MAKKFDTNPLDPKFPEKVKERGTSTLGNENGKTSRFSEPVVTEEKTRPFAEPAETENQTRQFTSPDLNEFDSAAYQPPQQLQRQIYQDESDPGRPVSIGSITLPENIATMLPYIPFAYIGVLAGILELIFIPKSEPKVRYHAAQGVAANVAVWIVLQFLGFASWGSDLANTAGDIFGIVTAIMLLVFAYKAWKGRPIHIQTIESLTDWLEEKIRPRKN